MPLGGRLRSGLTYPLESLSDWAVFQEVIVNGAYDSALSRVLENTLEPEFHAMDLGCNVGFFTLYLVDRLLREEQYAFKVVCVDASPLVLEEAARTFNDQPTIKLAGRVHLLQGLVGLREGEAGFVQQDFHAASTRDPVGSQVPYLDLETICPAGRLSLIKCDIEGAELDFIKTYPELLKRTHFLLIEWHSRIVDVVKGEGLLRDLGFMLVEHTPRGSTSTALWMNKGYQSADPLLLHSSQKPSS